MNVETIKLLDEIVASLQSAGFEPYEQLTGYVVSNNPIYITRLNGAREKIANLDISDIKQYLDNKKISD